MGTQGSQASIERLQIGKIFEALEKSGWIDLADGTPQFEAPTQWQGKKGRVDIRLAFPEKNMIVLVEIKATNWDAMRPHRVRPNALRHVRQLWRYIEADLDPMDVIPAIVYPAAPLDPVRKQEVERILGDHLIQTVWRTDGDETKE